MEILILTSSSSEEFKSKLHNYTKSLEFNEGDLPPIQRLALIIDGPTLTFAVEDEQTKLAFFRLGLTAASVVCCRVSPK
jgi:magnesium-transporting ATPase (P-type)